MVERPTCYDDSEEELVVLEDGDKRQTEMKTKEQANTRYCVSSRTRSRN